MINLSYIIPVYNCEKYLSECIDSIYKQNLNQEEFEIIIINDGSTDNSEKIIDRYIPLHKNITYIKQENKGLSRTRNLGMSIAKGKYIQFVDADDYLEPLSANYLLKAAIDNQLDIITFRSNKVSESSSVCSNTSDVYSSMTTICNRTTGGNLLNISNIQSGIEYMSIHNWGNSVWYYIFSKKIIDTTNLRFKPNLFCEDSIFTMELFLNAKRFASTEVIGYNYRYNPVSIMHNKNHAHLIKIVNDYKIVALEIEKIIMKYKSIMTEECMIRCNSRKNEFIFFMLIRAIKLKQPINWIKQLLTELSNLNFYPIQPLNPIDFKGIRWKILHIILNNKFCYLLSCQLYKLIK